VAATFGEGAAPLTVNGPFGDSHGDAAIVAPRREHESDASGFSRAVEELARQRLAGGDFAGAAIAAREISARDECRGFLIGLARAASHAGDPRWLRYSEEAEHLADGLSGFLDDRFDQNSRMPLLRWHALVDMADLYRACGMPARAIGAMARSSQARLALHAIREIIDAQADTALLAPRVSPHLAALRAALERGEMPARKPGGEPEDQATLRAAMARTWMALGDPDRARDELAAIARVDPELRAGIAAEIDRAAPAPATAGQAPEKARWVSVEEIAGIVQRGDPRAAERLADLQLDTRERQEYWRDVARAHLDRGDRRAARRIAGRIETAAVRGGLLREIDRIAGGGAPCPPSGEIVAVVIDNHQPGNPEKQ